MMDDWIKLLTTTIDCQPDFFYLGVALPVYDSDVRERPIRRGCLFWWVGSRLLPLSHLFAGWNRRISGPFHSSSETVSTTAWFTLSSKVLPSFWGQWRHQPPEVGLPWSVVPLGW